MIKPYFLIYVFSVFARNTFLFFAPSRLCVKNGIPHSLCGLCIHLYLRALRVKCIYIGKNKKPQLLEAFISLSFDKLSEVIHCDVLLVGF